MKNAKKNNKRFQYNSNSIVDYVYSSILTVNQLSVINFETVLNTNACLKTELKVMMLLKSNNIFLYVTVKKIWALCQALQWSYSNLPVNAL